jgi:hypothetical protein
MNIDLKKLVTILENKSNRAINMLDEIKCTTPEFKTILDSVLNNLNAIKQVKQYDIDCTDCKTKLIEEEKEHSHPKNLEIKENQPDIKNEKPTSVIGKKWIPFKGTKGEK